MIEWVTLPVVRRRRRPCVCRLAVLVGAHGKDGIITVGTQSHDAANARAGFPPGTTTVGGHFDRCALRAAALFRSPRDRAGVGGHQPARTGIFLVVGPRCPRGGRRCGPARTGSRGRTGRGDRRWLMNGRRPGRGRCRHRGVRGLSNEEQSHQHEVDQDQHGQDHPSSVLLEPGDHRRSITTKSYSVDYARRRACPPCEIFLVQTRPTRDPRHRHRNHRPSPVACQPLASATRSRPRSPQPAPSEGSVGQSPVAPRLTRVRINQSNLTARLPVRW